jgi:hypothetical protein
MGIVVSENVHGHLLIYWYGTGPSVQKVSGSRLDGSQCGFFCILSFPLPLITINICESDEYQAYTVVCTHHCNHIYYYCEQIGY